MTPHTDKRGGTLILDRRLGKLGRKRVASGTTDPEIFDAINQMVTQLKRDRKWDLLALIVKGIVRPVDLYETLIRGQADTLPTGDEARPFKQSAERWLANADLAEQTKLDYGRWLAALYRPNAVLKDVPEIMKRAKHAALRSGKRSTYNHTRAAVLSLLFDQLDEVHPVYRAVFKLGDLELTPRPGNPQTPDQIRVIAENMGKDADMVWAVCLTGMRRTEYWYRPWSLLPDRVRITSAKKGAPREVPLVYAVAKPRIGYSRFYHHLSDVTNGAVNVHDLRKTYMTWLEDTGIARIRRRIYLGHKVKDVSELYERKDVTRYLVEDAERLRVYLGEPPAKAAGLKLA